MASCHESRILQVTIFGTLHKNPGGEDFSPLLPDVMIIADEVGAQLTQAQLTQAKLTQAIGAFTKASPKSAAA
jgi:hypothetical protein